MSDPSAPSVAAAPAGESAATTADAAPAASGARGTLEATAGPGSSGVIETLPPAASRPARLTPLSARTGEPVRPWTIWVSALAFLGSAIAAVAGLGLVMWDMASPFIREGDGYVKDDRFARASWLSSLWVTEPGSGWRVLLAVAVTLIGFLVAATVAVVGFYAFRGYRWTRIGGLVAIGVSLLTLTLNQPAWIAIGLAVLGAAPLWLPATGSYFDRWAQVRAPSVVFGEPVDHVFYGPLPRFR